MFSGRRMLGLAAGFVVVSASCSQSATSTGMSNDESRRPSDRRSVGDDDSCGSFAPASPVVVLDTSMGDVRVLLDSEDAPVTVANFLQYVRDGFYDGTIIHRIVEGEQRRIQVIQGGGHLPDMTLKQARPAIVCEADNGLSNVRGTIAMARDEGPHTADSQFFINTADNLNLDYHSRGPDFWGYAVFGRVEDMTVVDRIRKMPTRGDGDMVAEPIEPIVIRRAYVVDEDVLR